MVSPRGPELAGLSACCRLIKALIRLPALAIKARHSLKRETRLLQALTWLLVQGNAVRSCSAAMTRNRRLLSWVKSASQVA